MTVEVDDIVAYLEATGWSSVEQWRGARVWAGPTPLRAEVLVPPHEAGDADLRVAEVIDRVAVLENRPRADVVRDVVAPATDHATCRTPDSAGEGCALSFGERVLGSVREMLTNSARTVVEGPHLAFAGSPPARVRDLVRSIRMTAGENGGLRVTVAVPHADGLGRRTAVQLHDAAVALSDATASGTEEPPDGIIAAGVSVGFCQALGALDGADHRTPFALSFTWGIRMPAALPARTVEFPGGAGRRIQRIGRTLREVELAGPASVTGRIESLHDDPDGLRWRALVRGDLRTERGVVRARPVWVRCPGPTVYRAVVTAHREGLPVLVRGVREPGARQDLAVVPDGVAVLDPD